MGITTFVLDGDPNDKNFATSLGGLTKGVTPLEITSAYCTFANKGVYVPHTAITKVLDRNGKIIEQADGAGKVVISEESAADLTSMLEDVILRGTGKKAQIGRPAAGKTGTTSNYHDAWFVGYTPDLVVGVWVGKDNNTSTDGIMGGQTPAIIWSSFMKSALADTPVHDFDQLVVKRRSNKKINDLRGDGNTNQNRRRLNNYNSESESAPASTPAASTNQPASNTDNADSPKPRSSNSNQNYDDSHTQVYTPPSRNNDQTYYEPEPTYREPEPTYREPEPTYREPEPTYREPEPTYREPEPTPSSSDSSGGVYSEAPPTPGSGVSKSR